ncbi:MAG TPA: protein-L-isoaspartate O-methyltransferase [Sphingomicrobium sp.]|jgi:protein-L-isoaspartate(D-aspartate) O-methyltransferase|nr:protein-L-isoaspartate O-methyltransferase [Sphingomicrobium sp.]
MTVQAPIPDYAAARRVMIESQLRPTGVVDPAIVGAFAAVERENFVPESLRPLAYADRAIALGDGRFLTPPSALGKLLMQMMPRSGQRALVVGAASGYSAEVLRRMGLDVIALDSSAPLAGNARELGLNVVEGPLEEGWKKGAPYDQILIDGAVEQIPETIVRQLADGGRLGTALIDRGVTRLVVGRKVGDAFGYLSVADAGMPVLPGFNRPRAFTF